mgnify:CR=1 FL=1
MSRELSPFERTVCACPRDVENCTAVGERKGARGPLIPSDVARIAEALLKDGRITRPVEVFQWLRRSAGAILRVRDTGESIRVGTISPKRLPNGRCVFLGLDDRCTIHAVAPFGCSMFDEHQSEAEWQRRSIWAHTTIAADEHYQALRATLEE